MTIGYLFGAFTIILSTLLIEIPIIAKVELEFLINTGIGLFVVFGTISAGLVMGGMIWDFLISKSEGE